jgi:poly(3-hydroxyalkanoate) synthetase
MAAKVLVDATHRSLEHLTDFARFETPEFFPRQLSTLRLGHIQSYGRLEFDDIVRTRLRDLSSECDGWIVFDDAHDESWLPMHEWLERFDGWKARGGRAV